MTYGYRFEACKVQIARLFPGVDVSHLDLEASDDKVKEEEDWIVLSSTAEAEVPPTTEPAFELASEPATKEALKLCFILYLLFSISCNELFINEMNFSFLFSNKFAMMHLPFIFPSL